MQVEEVGRDDAGEDDFEMVWDDVNDIPLPLETVNNARREEMQHMKGNLFKVVKKEEAWRSTGKPPMTTQCVCVGADEAHGTGAPTVRSRWVARGFKGKGEKDREDLFSATRPIELMRLVIGRPQREIMASSARRCTLM